jgi:hypothetical protein
MTVLCTKQLILFAFFAIVLLLHVPKCYSHLIINRYFQFYMWRGTLSLKILLPCQNFPVRRMKAAKHRLHDVNAAMKKLMPEGSSVTRCICSLCAAGSIECCAAFWLTEWTQISNGNTNFQTCGPVIMFLHVLTFILQSGTKLSLILEDL